MHLQCIRSCRGSKVWPNNNLLNGVAIDYDPSTFRARSRSSLPRCEKCDRLARPNVSFFSDTNFSFKQNRYSKQKQQFIRWLEHLKRSADLTLLIIEIGCGTSIHSLRLETEVLLYHTPELSNRCKLIRINPCEFDVNSHDANQVGIGIGSLEGLKRLFARE